MNGRDGNWELKQSPRKRDKGAILARCRRGEELGQGINTEYIQG